MRIEEKYRDGIAETLNELQTAMLMLAQVELKISQSGNYLQNMSHKFEEFINEQKTE
ncbi:MAG: hypothetical protein NHB32_08160 [Fischerella sp. CENA71]|nr:hypothetical protein [Fischerella sp. CENA71]